MAYGIKYRFEFHSKIQNLLNRIDILEDGFVGSVTVLDQMGATPINIKWDGGDFDKDTPIVSSEATLQFVQTDDFDIDTFFSNLDQQFKVNHYINSVLNWTGFIQTDDLSQPYIDPPNYFTVKAVDGLAFLKTIDLTGTDGEGIWGLENIMYYVQRCLSKTGHQLNINNWINIFPYEYYGSGSFFDRAFNASVDPFNYCKVFGQSFMTGKNKWDNCYNVLSKIMFSFQARCFQWEGEWHFVRVEDYIYYNDLLTSSEWDYVDDFFPIDSTANKDFSIEIGKDSELKMMNRSVIESRRRPVKSTKLTHVFKQWPQIIRNDRFLEGDYQILLSDSNNAVYTLEHWTLTTITSGVVSAGAAAYSRFELTNNYVTDQYMYIIKPSGSTTYKVMSTSVPVITGDKLNFSYRMRQTSSTTGSGTAPSVYCFIRIDSSNVYWLTKAGTWRAGTYNKTTESFTNSSFIGIEYSSSDDPRVWRPYSLDSDYFPADGDLYIMFTSDGIRGSAGEEVRHADIEVTIIPFVYNKVSASGQYDEIISNDNIIDRSEEDLDICNFPTPTNQGYIGGLISNVLTPFTNWFHAGIDEEVPFMRIINQGYFRSLYRTYYTLDGEFVGISWDDNGTTRFIGMINSFYVAGSSKRYITSGMEVNYKTEIVNTQLIELFIKDGNDDIEDGDSQIFRYLDIKDFDEPISKTVTKADRIKALIKKAFNFKKLFG